MLGAGQDFKSKYLSGARDTTVRASASLAHVPLLRRHCIAILLHREHALRA